MICLTDRSYQQNVTTMEKIRDEWQNEHIKACEVTKHPKHLHMAAWSSGFAVLAAGLRDSADLLVLYSPGSEAAGCIAANPVCVKHGFWIQGPIAPRFLLSFYYFYFYTSF